MRSHNFAKNIHYSWFITLGTSLIFFLSAGLSGGMFAIFLPGLVEKMNLSYSQASFIPTLSGFVGLFVMLFVRKIINSIGISKTMILGGLFITFGTFITSSLKSLGILYLGAVIIGLGYGLCSTIPISMLIVRWFNKKIGFAIGLTFAGSGIAVILGSPIFSYIILNFGLRRAYIVLSLTILLTTIIASVLLRDYPKDKNLTAYGSIEMLTNNKGIFDDDNKDLLYKSNHDSRRFYLFIIVIILMSIPIRAIVSHMSSILISKGVDPYVSMNMVSIFGFSMVISKMLYGYIMDKLGSYKTILLTFPIWLLTITLYFVLDLNIFFVILFSLIIGIGPAIGTVPIAVWVSELFGKSDIEKNLPIAQIFANFGAAVGIYILGVLVDLTGDYSLGMTIMFSLTLVSFILLGYFYRKRNNINKTES